MVLSFSFVAPAAWTMKWSTYLLTKRSRNLCLQMVVIFPDGFQHPCCPGLSCLPGCMQRIDFHLCVVWEVAIRRGFVVYDLEIDGDGSPANCYYCVQDKVTHFSINLKALAVETPNPLVTPLQYIYTRDKSTIPESVKLFLARPFLKDLKE